MSDRQSERLMSVTTALDDDELLFYRMQGSEEVGRLYEFEVDLLSENIDIPLEDVLAEPMSVQLEQSDGEIRYFNGYVSQFAQTGSVGGYLLYRASVRPWFWFLTRTSNCRIFQAKTVPEIISEVLGEHAFADYEDALSDTYRQWDYCVQYRESDFSFLSRLMEQEGIYYYFKHTEGKNTLVLADAMSAHSAVPSYEEIPYFELNNMTAGDRETITSWNLSLQVQPGTYATTDYDFEKPKASLMSKLMSPMQHSVADYEVYDYPGEFIEPSDGERYARIRLEELQSPHNRADGTTNARGMVPGMLFTLENHLRQDQNKQYLVLSARYSLQTHSYGTAGDQEWRYECSFSVASADVPYRSQRVTPKPIVQGPQTAIVVGPAGETIWPDKYGRVKVQFYWDRLGVNDETSSCWMRVSQNRAGKNWGESYVPHVGHEVIVSFLEGDPDRPIVTGRVYNADNMPPVGLPGGKTQLAMRDQGNNEMIWEGAGSKQTMHFQQDCGNELLLDGNSGAEKIELRDKYGNELIFDVPGQSITLHSPSQDTRQVFDMDGILLVTNGDERVVIHGNQNHVTIGNRETWINKNNQRLVGGDQKVIVQGKNELITTKSSISTVVGARHSTKVGAFSSITVGATSSKNVAAVHSFYLGPKVSISNSLVHKIGKDKEWKKLGKLFEEIDEVRREVSGDILEFVDGDVDWTVGGKYSVRSKEVYVQADKLEHKIAGGSYKVESSTFKVAASGAVDIDGSMVSINGNSLKVS